MSTLRTNTIQTITGKPILNSTGSILQVGYEEFTQQVSKVTVQTYEILYSKSITATAANSRYLLIGNVHGYSTTNSRWNIGYSVTINGATTRIIGTDGSNGDSWGNAIFTPLPSLYVNRQAMYTSTASAGTTLTFNFLVAHYDAATMYYNWSTPFSYNHKSTFTIMEISA